jgi:hypothetical protein
MKVVISKNFSMESDPIEIIYFGIPSTRQISFQMEDEGGFRRELRSL